MPDESELRLCPNVKFSVPDSTRTPKHLIIREASDPDRTIVSLDFLRKNNKTPYMLPAAICRRTGFTVGERVRHDGKPVIALTRLATCARKCETTEGCLEKP